MKKILIAILFPLGALCQDSAKVDTLPAKLWRAEGKNFHRAVDGFVVMKRTPSGCLPMDYLTTKKVRFPPKYRIEDYYIICSK